MAYPVAYRTTPSPIAGGPSETAGFQRGVVPHGMRGTPVPMPPDLARLFPPLEPPSWGPPIKPPNVPFGRVPVPAGIPAGALRSGLLRGVGRLVPLLNGALTAWDLWQWANGILGNTYPDPSVYTLVQDCGYKPGSPWLTDLNLGNCSGRFAVPFGNKGLHHATPGDLIYWWNDNTPYPPNPTDFGSWYMWRWYTRGFSPPRIPLPRNPRTNPAPTYDAPPFASPRRRPQPFPVTPRDPNDLPHPIFDPYTPNPPVRPDVNPMPQPIPRPMLPRVNNPQGWPQYREGGYDVRQRYGGSQGRRQREYTVPPIEVEFNIPVQQPGTAGPDPVPTRPSRTNQSERITPQAGKRVRNPSNLTPRSRTSAEEREKKARGKTGGAIRAIGKALGAISEVNDAIDALWKALPSKYQQGANFAERGYYVVKHWEHIDAAAAFENIWFNEIADKSVGGAIGNVDSSVGSGTFSNLNRAINLR